MPPRTKQPVHAFGEECAAHVTRELLTHRLRSHPPRVALQLLVRDTFWPDATGRNATVEVHEDAGHLSVRVHAGGGVWHVVNDAAEAWRVVEVVCMRACALVDAATWDTKSPLHLHDPERALGARRAEEYDEFCAQTGNLAQQCATDVAGTDAFREQLLRDTARTLTERRRAPPFPTAVQSVS